MDLSLTAQLSSTIGNACGYAVLSASVWLITRKKPISSKSFPHYSAAHLRMALHSPVGNKVVLAEVAIRTDYPLHSEQVHYSRKRISWRLRLFDLRSSKYPTTHRPNISSYPLQGYVYASYPYFIPLTLDAYIAAQH